MIVLELLRLKRTMTEDATYGVLTKNQIPFCVTLELPWKNNEPQVSCIPAGQYVCYRDYSEKLKSWTYLVSNVPKRSGIRLHCGNLTSEIQGCILVGESFDPIVTKKASGNGIADSKHAFFELIAAVHNEKSFILNIIEV